MTNTNNTNINYNDKCRTTKYRPYDNRIVKNGEVLVPMMMNDAFIKLLGKKSSINIYYWIMAGRKYKVGFYPVPIEFKKIAMQQYYYDLNEFLGERRDARCLVPQPDGSHKVCPKKNGDNHPDCAHCPYNGVYEREDKVIISLDTQMDDYEYDPAFTTNETSPLILKMEYEELLAYLADKPRMYDIVTMGFSIGSKDGNLGAGDRKELVKKVMAKYRLKPSRAYQVVNKTFKEVEKFFRR